MGLVLSMLWGRLAPLLRLVPWWAWVVGALLAWGGYQRHHAQAETRLAAQAEQAAAVQAATATAERQARAQEQAFADQVRSAADAYRQNLARAQGSAAAARNQLDGVLNAAGRAATCPASPGASAPGRTDGPAAVLTVLGECAAALQTVAAAADADGARLKGLQDYVNATRAASASTQGNP